LLNAYSFPAVHINDSESIGSRDLYHSRAHARNVFRVFEILLQHYKICRNY